MAENKGSSQVHHNAERQRERSFTRIFSLFGIAAAIAFLICLVIGLTQGIWQVTVVGCITLVALGVGYASQGYVRQKNSTAAEAMAIVTFITAFAVPTLFWANAAWYYLAGGVLIILIAGALFSSPWRHRWLELITFIAALLICSNLNLFNRFDIQEYAAISLMLPALTSLILLGALWQFYQSMQVSTIRIRLLVGFILVAVVPLAISALVASLIGTKSTVDNAVNMLTAVATLKEQSMITWLENLQGLLHAEYQRDQAQQSIPRLLTAKPVSPDFKFNHGNLSARLNATIATRKEFDEIFILNKNGNVVFSTFPDHEGMNLSREKIFTQGTSGLTYELPFSQPEFKSTGVVVAEPIIDQNGETLGVLAGFTGLEHINKIMQENAGTGSTGETFLVASDYTLITPSIYPGYTPFQSDVISPGAINAIVGKKSGSNTYENYNGTVVVGVYRWLPEMNLALLAEQNRSEIFEPTIITIVTNVVVSIFLVLGTIVFAVVMTNSISRPIAELTETTRRIADGELELNASVGERKDEIALLANSFNKMTERLRSVIGGLEELVNLRTTQLEKRSEQIQAASRLGSAATSILKADELINQVVHMIQEQFQLSYVGLYLIDEDGEHAVMRAGTGETRQALIQDSSSIKVGQGLVGACIQNGQAHVSQAAPEETGFTGKPNPLEPFSEAAIPLRSRGQVLGAIALHSNVANEFDENALLIFQTLADQVAVAIDNARLFEESQNALEVTRRAYGELSRQAWLERLGSHALHISRSRKGLHYARLAHSLEKERSPGGNGHGKQPTEEVVELPIEVRGTVIGTLRAKKGADTVDWTREEQELLARLGEQLGVALDSARLFEETLLRAERERLISDITNRVRETLDIDTVLKTAAAEMQKALDLEEVEVRMKKVR